MTIFYKSLLNLNLPQQCSPQASYNDLSIPNQPKIFGKDVRSLYIKFEDIKINVISEEPVGSLLTLFLETSTSMDQIYSLFVKNPLYEIILYDANNKMSAVRVGYEIIESFTYNPINNYYMMVLSKKKYK